MGVHLAGWQAQAAAPPGGVATIQAPLGGLAIDGNLFANTPSGTGDWLASSSGNDGVLAPDGSPLDPTRTFHFIDPFGNSGNDIIFGGGLKWTDNPNVWTWSGGKPSAKTEINNVLMHIGTDTQGHVWTAVAADRASTSGDSYIDFEFLQNPMYRTNNGKFISYGPSEGRTVNDLLLSLAFTGGGKVADFLAYRWQALAAGGFGYVDVTGSLPVGRVFVNLNTTTIPVPYGAFGQTTYAPNAFAEAAVDLTALLSSFDPCTSFGFKTIMIKTKASASSSASIEDLIDPIQYSLRIGPSADAGADQVRCYEGPTNTFSVRGEVASGLTPVASTTWTVESGNATIESPNSLSTVVQVASGSAVLRLTGVQMDGCVSTDTVVLSVSPLPVGSISGPSTVCPNSSVQFQGPAGMSGYSWAVSGNATLIGATNTRAITIQSGSICDQNFNLSLVVISNGCSSTSSAKIQVADSTAPTLAAPADLVLECPADIRTNVTGTATAQDECGQVAIAFSDSITPGCGATKTIVRTWTATDACGNTTRVPQTITVRDTVKPSLIVPPALTLECPADTGTNATGTATALDACGGVVISYSDVVAEGCGNTKVVTRTWSAMDACGNLSTGVQVLTVKDTTRPTLTMPANVTLECPADVSTNATGTAAAADACGNVTILFSDSVSTNCGGAKLIARTWTATDECGNSSSAVQTIGVGDTTSPVLTLPPDLTLDCPADTRTNATGLALAQDACGTATVTFRDSVSNNCAGAQIIVRTWTAADECGNSSQGAQTITVRDVTKPALVVPPNLVLECPADTSTNATGRATAQDACSEAVIAHSDTVSKGCGGTEVISRRWTATDGCGNSVSAVQTITVRDTTLPSLVLPADLVLECPADISTNATGIARGQDACGNVAITFQDSVTNGCGGTKLIARSWTATDDCGNARHGVQTITVRDTAKPSLIVPPDLVLECPANLSTNSTGTAVAQDACGKVRIAFSDAVTNLCGNTKIVIRTWTATDDCGNATAAAQKITVQDTTSPTLKLPASLVLECPGDTRTNATGVPVTQDAGGSVLVSYSDVVSNSCGLTRTVQRLWTVTDSCGNSTNGLQTITVRDTTKPSITCRAISVQCPGDVPPPYTNLAAFLAAGGTASDSCSATLAFALVSDTGIVGSCPGKVTRVYRVMDDCGSFAESAQTITVDDTIAPVIKCPPSLAIDCAESMDPMHTGRATATDNCDPDPVITYTNRTVPSEYSLNWYAADPVVGSAPYLPSYRKLGPASLPPPEAARLTGRAVDPLRNAVAYGPSANELDALTSLGGEPMCLGQVVPFEAVIAVDGGPGPEKGTIEFSASWSTYTTSNDQFGYDKNYMVYCAFVDPADPGSIDPHFNARVESYSSRIINPGAIDEKIQGTFRVSGLDTGDRVIVEIWVVLMSTLPGHVGGTIASDLVSAEKATIPPEPITTGTKTISIGNLSKIAALPAPQEQPPQPPLPPQPPVPPGAIVTVIDRTWTATDHCGNRGSCVQRITVRDATPPTLSVPSDVVVEAPADVSTNVTGMATAQDACGQATVSFVDSTTNLCGLAKTITRIWTAIDEWGNSTNAAQTIVVRDTARPQVIAPANITLECPADGSTNSTGTATASDAGGVASISYTDSITMICGNARVINRTWTSTDVCGNVGSAVQQITIQDTTPPVMVATPSRSAMAGEPFGFIDPEVSDACSGVTLTVLSTRTNQISLTETQITRIWQATDACGNSAEASQTITIKTSLAMLMPAIVSPPRCLAGCVGGDLSLAVSVTGLEPMSYVWRFNGQIIPGATDSTLALTNIGLSAAGLYSVTVANAAGSVTSPQAVINVAPKLLGAQVGGKLTLTWPEGFALQVAPEASGPFADVAGAASPYSQNAAAPRQFFRLRPLPFQMAATALPSGQTRINLTGAPGINVMIQASTDLIHWVTISTNTAPAILDEAVVPQGSLFYRAIPLLSGIKLPSTVPPAIGAQPQAQTGAAGGGLQLTAGATGPGPFTFQWQRNGVNLPGATAGMLDLENLNFADAGLYRVIIGGAGGSVTSRVAVVNVAPRVAAARVASGLSITWPEPFILRSASTPLGPFSDVAGATSPYLWDTQVVPQQFFRLSVPQPRLSLASLPGGQFQVSCSGAPGINYVLQGTTDFVNWVNLDTNTAPWIFVDRNASQFNARFYRTVPAQ